MKFSLLEALYIFGGSLLSFFYFSCECFSWLVQKLLKLDFGNVSVSVVFCSNSFAVLSFVSLDLLLSFCFIEGLLIADAARATRFSATD